MVGIHRTERNRVRMVSLVRLEWTGKGGFLLIRRSRVSVESEDNDGRASFWRVGVGYHLE